MTKEEIKQQNSMRDVLGEMLRFMSARRKTYLSENYQMIEKYYHR